MACDKTSATALSTLAALATFAASLVLVEAAILFILLMRFAKASDPGSGGGALEMFIFGQVLVIPADIVLSGIVAVMAYRRTFAKLLGSALAQPPISN